GGPSSRCRCDGGRVRAHLEDTGDARSTSRPWVSEQCRGRARRASSGDYVLVLALYYLSSLLFVTTGHTVLALIATVVSPGGKEGLSVEIRSHRPPLDCRHNSSRF